MKTDELVTKLAEPVAKELGLELVDAEYIKEAQNMYLRVYIDKPGGVNIDDCQLMSEKLGEILDIEDPIKEAYIFEVSSPGLERVLKKDRDFEKYLGELILIKLFAPRDEKKEHQGLLKDFNKQDIYIETDEGIEIFARKDIAVAKRVYLFNGRL